MKLRYPFDPQYMNALFQVGYKLGKAGYHWAKLPPGFGGPDQAEIRAEAAAQ